MAPGLTARVAAVALALAVTGLVAACGMGASGEPPVPPPAASVGAPTTVSGAALQARGDVVRALGAAGVQVGDPQVPVLAPETPSLATVPRIVVQALLPGDPGHGFITIYDLPDSATARSLGMEQAAWLASGPGRVHFPPDAHLTLRQLGTSLVYFSWTPESGDPHLADVERAIETIGTAIDVPS